MLTLRSPWMWRRAASIFDVEILKPLPPLIIQLLDSSWKLVVIYRTTVYRKRDDPLQGLSVSGSVRERHSSTGCCWNVIGTNNRLFSLQAQTTVKAFRVACSEQENGVNISKVGSSNSSFTTKSCVCVYHIPGRDHLLVCGQYKRFTFPKILMLMYLKSSS
jgi:hypothetical protein